MSFGDYHDFEVPYANDEVAWIKDRVRSYRWFQQPAEGGWRYGASQDYLQRLQQYWLDQYSWRRAVTQLNAFPHYRVDMGGGYNLHCIHRRSPDVNAIPLLISHGWPGSVLEFTHLVERLAEPERAGVPAFHVIAPSLPGYAWSDKPKTPLGPRAAAKMYDRLMEALGYPVYLAQGGDWGCVISGWLGLDSARCRALHLNGFGLRPSNMRPHSPEETAWLGAAKEMRNRETAYLALQSTKPQSLGFAMMDSPMGVAAWLAEKFCTWGDQGNALEVEKQHLPAPDEGEDMDEGRGYAAPPPNLPGDPPFSMEWLLTNIMIYLTTRSFNSSTWLYAGMAEEGGFSMPAGARVEKPTAAACFPKDLLTFPPRPMAERGYNIARWTQMPRGGHFASVEEPELFIEDLRAYGAELQQASHL
ncbi:MAG: epoxide hydrolase [Pseudomonadota bacterium]